MNRCAAILLLALVSGSGRIGAQEPVPSPSPEAPSFPAQVDLVTVDVVATDKDGLPVPGLTRDDFVLEEDGRPQAISSFEGMRVPSASAVVERPRPRVSTNYGPRSDTGRTFVVVFDDVNMTGFDSHRAKAAVRSFLETGVREGDRVSLIATSGAAWWSTRMEGGREELLSLLERLEGRRISDTSFERITPWEAMRIHVYRDEDVTVQVTRRLESYGVIPPELGRERPFDNPVVLERAQRVYFDTLARSRTALEVLERILAALTPTRGRKALVLVSQGFIRDPTLEDFKRVLDASRRSNVAIYFLDTRGLEGLPLAGSSEIARPLDPRDIGATTLLESAFASEGAQTLAVDSGGFAIQNTNDLASGIKRITAESEVYYLLGYLPTNRTRDGTFRKIKVSVARKGVKVRARRGYYAPLHGAEPAPAPGDEEPDFQRALDAPFPEEGIPLRMSSYVFQESMLGKASVLVATDVDIRGFAFEEKDGRAVDDLEYLLVVAHGESGEHFRYDEKVEMSLLPKSRRALEQSWYAVAKRFDLSPGRYQARIVVRDRNGGRVGSVIHDFEVPPVDQFRTSTPLITDSLQAGEGRPRPVLRVRRTYTPADTLYCEFEVYGASRDAATGMPRVAAGYSIRRPDGTTLASVAPNVITPSSLGQLSRLVGAPLRGATPGEYELVLRLRDELAGKDLEVREPFTVVAATGGS
jgi:VWFA-related protein